MSIVHDLTFIHEFVPPPEGAVPAHTLLMLHGTGGNEQDLLPLGHQLDPCAALLSPRGKVLEHGMPRFFRRLAEGVFDVPDLKRRTDELADFVEAATTHYGLDPNKVIAVGYSNGANIAGSMILLRPETLHAAILFRPMVPLIPDLMPDLSGFRILIAAGNQDPIVPPAETERLVDLMRTAGADVTFQFADAGHGLTAGEIDTATRWLEARL